MSIDPQIAEKVTELKNAVPGSLDADNKAQSLIDQIAAIAAPYIPAKFQPLITPVLAVIAVVVSIYVMKPTPAPVQPPVTVNVQPNQPVITPPTAKQVVTVYVTSDADLKTVQADPILAKLGVKIEVHDAGSKVNGVEMPAAAKGTTDAIAIHPATAGQEVEAWLNKK
jgi:hypothetical protein